MGQVTSERMKNQNPCPLCYHHYIRNHNRHGCRKCGCKLDPMASHKHRRISSGSGQAMFMKRQLRRVVKKLSPLGKSLASS